MDGAPFRWTINSFMPLSSANSRTGTCWAAAAEASKAAKAMDVTRKTVPLL
jgi:hypothetical protein